MLKIFNIINKINYLEEVATLEHEEWAENKEKDKQNRIATIWKRHMGLPVSCL